MANLCGNTRIDDSLIKGLKAELNNIRSAICTLQGSSGGGLPSQGGHSGEFLTTNGTTASWSSVAAGWGTTGTIATLTGDGTVDLNGHELSFTDTGGATYEFTPTYLLLEVGSGQRFQYDDETSTIRMRWDGDHEINITSTGATYTADTHTFNGNVGIGTSPGPLPLLIQDASGNQLQVNDNQFAYYKAVGDFYMLNVDASANSMTYTADTHTINGEIDYNGNGKLLADRTVDLNGHDLYIANSSTVNLLTISEADFYSQLRANDGTAESGLTVHATIADNDVSFLLGSNNGSNNVNISGDAIANTITYTADTHTIVGNTGVEAHDLFYVTTANYHGRAISVVDGGASTLIVGLGDVDGDGNSTKINIDDGAKTVTYTADTHTITGVVKLNLADSEIQFNGSSSNILTVNGGSSGFGYMHFINNGNTQQWAHGLYGANDYTFRDVTGAADVLVLKTTDVVQMPHYGAGAATFDASGNISSASDERLKDIESVYSGGMSELYNLRPIVFRWNKYSGMETDHSYIGFSAQNVRKALGHQAVGEDGKGYLSIQDRAILAVLVNAVKEQGEEIKKLKSFLENR